MRFSFVLVAGPRRHLSLGGSGARHWPAGSAGIEPAYGNEDQAEVGHPVQQAMQRGLIRHRAGDDRLAVVAGDLEALEPGRPSLIEDALDTDLVARRRRRAAHARTPADGQPRLAPAGERSRVSSAICSVPSVGSVICTLRSGTRARRHPKVPIGWNLPRCYGSGLISCVLDAADARGRRRPAGRLRHRNRGRRSRLYFRSDSLYVRARGNLTVWDRKRSGLRVAWPPSAYVTVGDSYTAFKASSPGRQRAVAICPGTTHDPHLSASELIRTILTEMLSTPSNVSRLESVYAVGVIWDSRQRAERSCICTV